MSTLVIGGSGFIGEALAYYTLNIKLENIYFLSKYPFRHIDNETLQSRFIKNDWRVCDYNKIVKEYSVDTVLILASGAHPRLSNDDSLCDIESNIIPLLRVIDSLLESKVKRIVFVSSAGALDSSFSNFHLSLESTYALGKTFIEGYLALKSNVFTDFQFSILRVSNPFGPFQLGDKGQGVIPIFLRKIILNEDVVFLKGSNFKKEYIFIGRLVSELVKVITNVKLSNTIEFITPCEVISAEELYKIIKYNFSVYKEPLSDDEMDSLFSSDLGFNDLVILTMRWYGSDPSRLNVSIK
tara:strand:- start:8786 stop:9676 length:891 start_codon:yes stop_codon:yes gene_type:complete